MSWHVQLRSGSRLGPLNQDKLLSLIEDGTVQQTDEVRLGSESRWRLVSDVPELGESPAGNSPSAENSLAAENSLSAEIDLLNQIMDGGTPDSSRKDESGTPPKRSAASVVRQARERRHGVEETEKPGSVDARESAENPVATGSRPGNAGGRAGDSPASGVTTSHAAAPTVAPVTHVPSVAESGGRLAPLVAGIKGLDKRYLIGIGLLVVISLGGVVAWGVRPGREAEIYTQYSAIYFELIGHRSKSPDDAAWNEFVNRSQSQIDDTLPWLEQNNGPGKRGISLLLYAGRDLHKLLDKPPHMSEGSEVDRRVGGYMDQLHPIYKPSVASSNEPDEWAE